MVGLLVVASFLAGCATDVANRYYGSTKYPPKDPKEVEVLWQRPSWEFTVIADFQSRWESAEDMRKKAAEIGADAVIVSLLGGNYDRTEEKADSNKSHTYTRITGTAIKYNK